MFPCTQALLRPFFLSAHLSFLFLFSHAAVIFSFVMVNPHIAMSSKLRGTKRWNVQDMQHFLLLENVNGTFVDFFQKVFVLIEVCIFTIRSMSGFTPIVRI